MITINGHFHHCIMVTLILASLTMGKKAPFGFALLTIGAIIIIGFLEINHNLVNQGSFITTYGEIILLSILVIAVAGLQWLRIGQLNEGIERARRNEQTLIAREAALRESESKFRALAEESSEGLILTVEQGIVVEWNHALELITGVERNYALGKNVWDLQSLIIVPEHRTAERVELTKNVPGNITAWIIPQNK